MNRELRILILGLAPMILIFTAIMYSIHEKILRDSKIENIKIIRHVYEFPSKAQIEVEIEQEF